MIIIENWYLRAIKTNLEYSRNTKTFIKVNKTSLQINAIFYKAGNNVLKIFNINNKYLH